MLMFCISNSSLLFSPATADMSDFIESEAEESEEEFAEKDLKPKKTQRFMEEDGEMSLAQVRLSDQEMVGMWFKDPSSFSDR